MNITHRNNWDKVHRDFTDNVRSLPFVLHSSKSAGRNQLTSVVISVAEPHHFYAATAPAPGENFNAAPAPAAPAPAPTLLYSKAKFVKGTKVYTHVETILFI
jgi:hypothetical protein